jgi:CubicO group peptidase (beta-lactamase class C family)
MSYKNSAGVPAEMQANQLANLPRQTWDSPPWNRWSFQHVSEFLDTAVVSSGAIGHDNAFDLRKSPARLDSMVLNLPHLGRCELDTFLDETYTDGFLVVHNGAVKQESYFGFLDASKLHLSQSMAKSITAAALGVLVEQGLIDLNQQVTHYLPELKQTAYAGATIQHLLDMASGVAYSEAYIDENSDVALTEIASGWRQAPPGVIAPNNIWEQILGLKTLEEPHGSRWLYRSIETDVLAFCMEKVTGQRLPQIVSELLWRHIGAELDANFTIDSSGYGIADGGFNACLRDYARFGLLYLNEGKNLAGEQVVPAAWVAATRSANHQMFAATGSIGLPDGAYKNQFWIEDSVDKAMMCVGIFGQLIYINPVQDLLVVKLSTWPSALNAEYKVDTLSAIHQIADHLSH